MATYEQSIRAALDAYPDTDTFLHPRSKESVYAASYLRERIVAYTTDATLRKIVNFLFTGENPPEGKPAELKKLKPGGTLHTLLAQLACTQDKWLNAYNANTKMADDPDAVGIDLSIRKKYDAAIEEWGTHHVAGSAFWLEKQQNDKLASLVGLSREKHLRNIDKIWLDILSLHVCSYFVESMAEPVTDGDQFRSSHNKYFAFRQGYGFRCDARTPQEVEHQGFVPRYSFDCPECIKGTILEKAAKGIKGFPRMVALYKDNRDAMGEMGICVSRQMRGCTKFPGPKEEGDFYIYALGLPPNKLGFDTEFWQIKIGGTALWRPGEKVFYDVQPSEVLASVQIHKSRRVPQDPANVYFHFQILADHWQWHKANTQQQIHLNQELLELHNGGQIQSVLVEEDFYTDQAVHLQPAARPVPPAQRGQVARAQGGQPPPARGGPAPPAQGGPAPTFKCDQCGQTFPTSFALSTHAMRMRHRVDKAAE